MVNPIKRIDKNIEIEIKKILFWFVLQLENWIWSLDDGQLYTFTWDFISYRWWNIILASQIAIFFINLKSGSDSHMIGGVGIVGTVIVF